MIRRFVVAIAIFTCTVIVSTAQDMHALNAGVELVRVYPVEKLSSLVDRVICLEDDPESRNGPDTLLLQPPVRAFDRGPSSVRLRIAQVTEAGSEALYIDLLFQEHAIRLMSPPGGFVPGLNLLYDLSPLAAFFDAFSSDCWDSLTLVYDHSNELIIGGLQVDRNGSRILDWSGEDSLQGPAKTRRNFAGEILATKMAECPGPINGVAWWAFGELGKDDGEKYSPSFPGGWCSEFASWVLRHNGWNTPQGSIGTRHMRDFFELHGRLYAIEDIYAGMYVPKKGDYMSMWSGGHSGLFLSFIDLDPDMTPDTRINTIEGGGVVSVYERTLADIDHLANTN